MPQSDQSPSQPGLAPQRRELLIEQHEQHRRPRLARLWRYYRNEPRHSGTGDTTDTLPQTEGLPQRLRRPRGAAARDQPQHEVVIENDIAWRIHTLVDFMFGKRLPIQSRATDPGRARRIERFLHAVFEQAGGPAFFQDLALLGAVYGFVDVLVRVGDAARLDRSADDSVESPDPASIAEHLSLEPVEATRAVPAISAEDYRRLDAYMIHSRHHTASPARQRFLDRIRDRVLGSRAVPWQTRARTELFTPDVHEHYVADDDAHRNDRQLVEREANRLGRIPVVHIQNLPQPFAYEGLSEVEPLVPLQDELNTRLSDRANRVTFQSFKMYLGKGIEGFTDRPVGPGQMWSTDNPDASIQEFGSDGESPSEDAHINELREAMDKTSAVPPVAAGLVRDKLGNLTSENALRVTLMGLLARTEKKRITYGQGIERICEILLHAANVHGLLPNRPEERGIRLDWPDPVGETETTQLQNARRKLDLGVPRKQVLTELGYPQAE